jgi:hypothetical protein
MTQLNFTLEIINGSISILTFFLLFFLSVYLVSHIRREGFTWKTFLWMSTAASLVVALFIEKTGTLATRTVTWAWRSRGGNLPFTSIEDFFLIVGAILTVIGLIMMIRVLSRPRFGNWPWMVSTIVALDYVGVETFIHLMR